MRLHVVLQHALASVVAPPEVVLRDRLSLVGRLAIPRHGLRVVTTSGQDLACVQIAGLIARRIVCDVAQDETVLTGQRMGIIRFGSRVDIYLPPGVAPLVSVGQRSVAGETVVADLRAQEAARDGEFR